MSGLGAIVARGFLFLVLIVALVLVGCSAEPTDSEQIIVRVNDYQVSSDDVDRMLKFEADLNSNFYLSEDTRTAFIDELVQTQLLIQEAKKRKLDQRESFRKTIQRYWESTLIRDLLEEKGEQLRRTTIVSKEEVETFYKNNKDLLPEGTLLELSEKLVKMIEDEKVTARLGKWIEELRAEATVEIKGQALTEK